MCVTLRSLSDDHDGADQSIRVQPKTIMPSPHLAQEILDNIIDNLCDDAEVLQRCSLVSKSWIARTRKHLFAEVSFTSPAQLQSWNVAFPNPLSSPGSWTKTLRIVCAGNITAANTEASGWIKAFSNVCSFEVHTPSRFPVSLALFHGFSVTLKMITVGFGSANFEEVFNLLLSFPLLEDLQVHHGLDPDDDEEGEITTQIPATPPSFTGALDLSLATLHPRFIDRLLKLPNGIQFQKLKVFCDEVEHEVAPTKALVEGCSATLKDLHIRFGCKPMGHLSRVTALKFILLSRALRSEQRRPTKPLP